MLYITDKYVGDMNKDELAEMTSDTAIPQKEKILDYMRSIHEIGYTTAHVVDVFTKQQLKVINNERSDDVYAWAESEIYHFEKYNLKLNDDFIQHVLNQLNL